MTPAKKDTPPAPQLAIGSRYRILSLGSREEMIETRGIFRGVSSVGTIDGLAIELADTHGAELKGKTRIVPTHMVLAIDILEQVEKPTEKKEESNIHYG